MIARFWDVQQGRVCLDGTDIKTLHPEKYLKNVSMVFQDVYLFKDTIGNNIKVGKQGATQDEVIWAARKARCHDFIMKIRR